MEPPRRDDNERNYRYTELQRLVLGWDNIEWPNYSSADLLTVNTEIREDLLHYITEHSSHEITADNYFSSTRKQRFWLQDVNLNRLTGCAIKISNLKAMPEQTLKQLTTMLSRMSVIKQVDIVLNDPCEVLAKDFFMDNFLVQDVIDGAQNLSCVTVHFEESPGDRSRGFML